MGLRKISHKAVGWVQLIQNGFYKSGTFI